MPDSGNSAKSSRRRSVVLWAWTAAVSLVLMILVFFVFQPDGRVPLRTKEAVIRIDLKTMRKAIDKYTLDKQRPPQSLQELVNANYLRAIPVDPMTGQRDWAVDFGDAVLSPSVVAKGMSNVHSNSQKVSLDGTGYGTW